MAIHNPGITKQQVQTILDQQGNAVYNMDATPVNGGTVTIPDSTARVVNVNLWPAAELARITVVMPSTLSGRRVFLYADKAIAEVNVVSNQAGVVVRNGAVSLNMYDQTVFNTASLTVWARVVSS